MQAPVRRRALGSSNTCANLRLSPLCLFNKCIRRGLAKYRVADTVIECRGVWKVFGPRADESLMRVQREGLGQAEALKRFDCVVAVAGVDLEIFRGEIFCI